MSLHGQNRFDALAPRSALYQGPFGRIFADLPPAPAPAVSEEALEKHLLEIANNRMTERPGLTPAEIADDAELVEALEQEFGSELPAAYTYFGQFVDHDVTFDPASSLMRANDPNGLTNFRTPRLDLDNVYGRGPDEQPYLYDPDDPEKLAIGRVEGTELADLPRFRGRALIGDMRNDENAIVSQLQLAFLGAHNELLERAREAGVDRPFEAARRTLRWLYQYVVWWDFLERVADPEVWEHALGLEGTCGGGRRWVSRLAHLYNWKRQPFMPVEFSVAAYRFGHSMVRNGYQTNFPHRGLGAFAPIFDNRPASGGDDLRGFRPLRAENAIQWDWFLEMGAPGPLPQRARKIDTRLSNALAFLHEGGGFANVLAARNLLRGLRFELPTGESVAKKLCFPVVETEPGEPESLWFYCLKEAEAQGGSRLGKVGSSVVCAVFAGLLTGDPASWLQLDPCWRPDDDPLLREEDKRDGGRWSLASIVRIARVPVSAQDLQDPAALRRA